MGTKLKISFIVSLAINLLLIGMLTGYWTRGFQRRGRHFKPPPRLMERLTPEHAEMFHEAMQGLHEKRRTERKAIGKVREEVLQALTAPQFDAQAFQTKMQELHQLHGQMKDQLVQSVTELASQMNQQERKALAKILKQGPLGKDLEGRRRHPEKRRPL